MLISFLNKSILSLAIILLCSSCSLTNYYLNRTEKQYEKLGKVEWRNETDSSTIHWRKIGTGEQNLLLIHGFGPATEMQWEGLVKQLQNDFTILIPDLIYFGKSTSNVAKYDPRFITRQIYQSLQSKDVNKVHVAGISYGGLISSIFAHQYPRETEGLILIDALSKFMDSTYLDSLARSFKYNHIHEILIPSDGKSLKTLFQISFHQPKKYPAWLLNKASKILYDNQRAEKKLLLSYLTEHETDLKSLDFHFDGQVHIIWGKEDLLIPLSNAHKLKDYYNRSELTILPEIGHVAIMEDPTRVAQIIRKMSFKTE